MSRIGHTMASLADYDTGASLGLVDCTRELVIESRKAEPTGAVPAYRDGDEGPWSYCPPSRVEDMRRQQIEVRTVYVED